MPLLGFPYVLPVRPLVTRWDLDLQDSLLLVSPATGVSAGWDSCFKSNALVLRSRFALLNLWKRHWAFLGSKKWILQFYICKVTQVKLWEHSDRHKLRSPLHLLQCDHFNVHSCCSNDPEISKFNIHPITEYFLLLFTCKMALFFHGVHTESLGTSSNWAFIYRYLYRNKELIRKKRRDVRKLNKHIDYLHHKLER